MASEKDLVSVKVERILMSNEGPVVLLAPTNGGAKSERLLPIFIDHSQAINIQLAMAKGPPPPRPMTHDLFSAVLNELGGIVARVVIEDLQANTFYASLYVDVERNGRTDTRRFDARPSDCLALAVRVDAKIEVAKKVLEAAGIPRSEVGPPDVVEVDEDEGDFDETLGVSR